MLAKNELELTPSRRGTNTDLSGSRLWRNSSQRKGINISTRLVGPVP